MKLLLALLVTSFSFAADWEAVQRISPGQSVKVDVGRDETIRAEFVSANDSTLVVRSGSGERSLERTDIRRVRVADPGRRVRRGLIATAIGAGAGLGIGFAVCPHCANEGSAGKFTGPLTAAGAGLGAIIGFLPPPYRTLYKNKM